MKSWSYQTNWSRNLHKLIFKFNMTLPVRIVHLDLPVKWRNEHVMMPWPTLPPSSWLECVFKKTSGQPLLGGNKLSQVERWTSMLRDFWVKFRAAPGVMATKSLQTMLVNCNFASRWWYMEMKGVGSYAEQWWLLLCSLLYCQMAMQVTVLIAGFCIL